MPDAGLSSGINGGLFGLGAPNYGSLVKHNEARRQGIIDLGLQQIGAVFGGGSAPFYSMAKQPGTRFSPSHTYYSINNQGHFNPYWGQGKQPKGQTTGGLGNFGPLGLLGNIFGGLFEHQLSPRQVAKKAFERNQLFTKGETQNFEGFQQPFYDQRAKDYINYALPQVGQQYQQAQKALEFGLANRGLGAGSVANSSRENLERTSGEARQQVATEGTNQANQLKQSVEDARQQAIQQLYQSANPGQAVQSAFANAASLRQPSAFAPLGDLFSNLAKQYYLNQTLNTYRNQGNPYGGFGINSQFTAPPIGNVTY